MAFAADVDDYPTENLYFVWWYCQLGTINSPKDYPTANDAPIETLTDTITYFKTAAQYK
ncbi:hypothetical protein ACFLQT_01620 [Bacteroidota bacterium]